MVFPGPTSITLSVTLKECLDSKVCSTGGLSQSFGASGDSAQNYSGKSSKILLQFTNAQLILELRSSAQPSFRDRGQRRRFSLILRDFSARKVDFKFSSEQTLRKPRVSSVDSFNSDDGADVGVCMCGMCIIIIELEAAM